MMDALKARNIVNAINDDYVYEAREKIDPEIEKRAHQGYENLHYFFDNSNYKNSQIKKITDNLTNDGFTVATTNVSHGWDLNILW